MRPTEWRAQRPVGTAETWKSHRERQRLGQTKRQTSFRGNADILALIRVIRTDSCRGRSPYNRSMKAPAQTAA